MSDKSLFGALVRIVGLVLMLLGIQALFGLVMILFQFGANSPVMKMGESFMVMVF